jgi:hypothetical protein
MRLTASDVISTFNANLNAKGYASIGATTKTGFDALLEQKTSEATSSSPPSEAATAFFSRPLLGRDEQGTIVTGGTEQEYSADIDKLTEDAVARGQDPDKLHFVLGTAPIFDGPAGPFLGYEMRAAVEVTGMLQSPDGDFLPGLRVMRPSTLGANGNGVF